MRRHVTVSNRIASGFLTALLLVFPGLPSQAIAQQAGNMANSPGGFAQGELESQIRELGVVLMELRADVERSRQEASELREELRETREQLASLRTELAAHRASEDVTHAVTVASNTNQEAEAHGERIDRRLTRIEEDLHLQSAKLDEQYQTKVESASKYRVRLSGLALINLFANRGSVDNLDVPGAAQPRRALESGGAFGATLRQSMLGLELFGPQVGRARSGADIQFDFFGGFPDAPDSTGSGLVRLRTARVHFDWSRTSIVAGQDAPFFSPLAPTSLASVATPAFSYSGNLWTWTPQVRVEHHVPLSENSEFLVQGGILDAFTGAPPYGPYARFYRAAQAGESSRQPAYAVRTAWRHKAWGRPLTLGFGGYYARQNWGLGRTVDGWAGTADWSVPIAPWLELSGEFYRGRALGGLGAGSAHSVLYSGAPHDPSTRVEALDSTGGWSQLKFRATERLEFNGAFGQDVPSASDLRRFEYTSGYATLSLGRNQSGFVNAIYRLRSNLLFSAEYRRLWTSTVSEAIETADHLNLGFGVLF
jgi:hypothetical protein